MQPKVIWCLGMYASASTWLFNAVRLMAIQVNASAVKTYFVSSDLSHIQMADSAVQIIKSHEIGDPKAVSLLREQSANIAITMRDPRDAVTSLMRYHGMTFGRALELVGESVDLCAAHVSCATARVWHYESLFFEDANIIGALSEALGLQLTLDQCENVFIALQRPAVENYIARMASHPGILQDRVSGDLLDPVTHWHSHHAKRDGQIGRWRMMLSPSEVRLIETRCARYFELPQCRS